MQQSSNCVNIFKFAILNQMCVLKLPCLGIDLQELVKFNLIMLLLVYFGHLSHSNFNLWTYIEFLPLQDLLSMKRAKSVLIDLYLR